MVSTLEEVQEEEEPLYLKVAISVMLHKGFPAGVLYVAVRETVLVWSL